MKGAEDRFSDAVLADLRRALAESRWGKSVVVDPKVKIVKDFTFGRIDGRWKLVAGVQQQDIVFYQSQDSIDYADFKSKAMDKIGKYKGKQIHVPLLVLELKVGGKQLVTHQLITYSSISAQLKQVFPHCRYCLLIRDENRQFSQQTLLRHCKGFDRIFVGWEQNKDAICQYVLNHLQYLQEIEAID